MVVLEDRIKELRKIVLPPNFFQLENSPLEVAYVTFYQKNWNNIINAEQTSFLQSRIDAMTDTSVSENRIFTYPIFKYKDCDKSDSVIFMLHGLNERSWEKYLCWAEFLAMETHKPVILFPLAFHINRTPVTWCNPRKLIPWVTERIKRIGQSAENLTFANITLSDRLTDNPLRFYTSGNETAYNLWQLASEITTGAHPFFRENTHIDFFAYSIGALLSQILLLANPDHLFSDSKLMMFCGGSVFNKMNGNSRYIMDKEAFDKIFNYFQYTHLKQPIDENDPFDLAFKSMIDTETYHDYRVDFFESATNRLQAISLKKDIVIPTEGIQAALGENCSKKCLEEWDFPFEYSHETPFPTNILLNNPEVNQAFTKVMSKAADFLS
ncbi:MAG: DUF6051 family protein [Bacteroidales bacterium]|nr:DUF6051 family protein [Bacteroidales bacterium]